MTLEALYECMKQSGQHDDGLIALDFREQNTSGSIIEPLLVLLGSEVSNSLLLSKPRE